MVAPPDYQLSDVTYLVEVLRKMEGFRRFHRNDKIINPKNRGIPIYLTGLSCWVWDDSRHRGLLALKIWVEKKWPLTGEASHDWIKTFTSFHK